MTLDKGSLESEPAAIAQPGPACASAASDLTSLALRAAAGDTAAFSALVRATQEPLYYVVLRSIGHQQDARDIVQKTFLRAWSRRGDLEKPERWRSWVFSIALNLSRNHTRDAAKRRFTPLEESTAVVQAQVDGRIAERQQRARLREALDALPPRQREVVSLRIDAELSFREIAQTLGCAEGNARVNFHHGMKRLRSLLNPGEEPKTEVP